MENAHPHPSLLQVVLDTTDVRGLAEFYRKLLGYEYRPGDEPPPAGQPDERGNDWLVLRHPSTSEPRIAFQHVDQQRRSTWPDPDIPQQLHLDLMASSLADFHALHERTLALGATLLYDRSEDPQEPLHVYADPAGHPFCIFTWLT